MYCYRCGKLNADNAQHCSRCNAELSGYARISPIDETASLKQDLATAQEAVQQLRRYIPSVVAEGILHDQKRLRGEHREVAVLFADAVNFTSLSASLDAESVFNLINDLLGRLVACVHNYDGLVDKFTGDGLMAVFGAPIAHENDAELAVRAALDMQKATAEFIPIAKAQLGAPLQIRIGIHSGPAIAGILGTEEQAAYTVIGDTVNLAARLESQATPGNILVSPRVYLQTQPFFSFRAIETTYIKGVDHLITTYEVVGERAAPMPTRGVPGVTDVFLGHDEHLDELRTALRGFLSDQRGRIVTIRGEAGMGKSRLIAEWLSEVDRGEVKVWHGRGLPYSQGVGYDIFRSLLQDAINSYPPDSPWDSRVSAALRPFLKQIVGLPLTSEEEIPLSTLTPERISQLTALAIREWLLREAQQQPVILILDDFHWADDLSQDLLKTLSNLIDEVPVFFTVMTRPTPETPWGPEVHDAELCHTIEVTPLTPEQSRALLGHTVNLAGLPESIVNTILTRAEGNPFYIEEFVRMLIEKELLRLVKDQWYVISTVALEKIEVPTSLRGLMMARVDRLPEHLRHVLRNAAVIGLQFDGRLLQRVEHHFYGTENITPLLERLTEAGLLEVRPEVGPFTYAFRHILTQETIYDSILHSQRPDLHRVVAEAIKDLHRDDLYNQAEVLALHYDQARIRDNALYYTLLAGDRARHRFANREAMEYYSRALQLSQHLSRRETERWQAAIGLGDVQQHVGEYEEAIAFYQAALEEWKAAPAEAQAEIMLKLGRAWDKRGRLEEAETWLRQGLAKLGSLGNKPPDILAEIYAGLGWLCLRRGDLPKAQELLEQALALVDSTQHYDVLSSTLNRLGAVYYNQGDWDRAAQIVERALAIREKLGDLLGVARSSNNLGVLKWSSGNWTGALENYQRCLRVMEQIGDTEGIAIAHTNIGNVYIDMGEWNKAESNLRRGFRIAQRIANPYEVAQAHMNMGRLYLLQGNWSKAETHLNAALPLYSQAGARANPNLIDAYCLQGLLHLEREEVEAALEWGERSLKLLQEVSDKEAGESAEWGRYEQLMGRIALAQGQLEAACDHLRRGKEIFQANRSHIEIGRTAYWQGMVWLALTEPGRAKTAFMEAERVFQQLGASADLERARRQLAELC